MLITKYLLLVPYVIQHLLPIKTEKNITISYYLGRWNQVATSRSTILLGTGVKYKDVTADYDLFNETLLSVCNSGIDNKNNHTSISGYSYITGNSETKRKLHFDGVPVDGNYWIVKLGPIINDTYRYAVVSGAMTKFFGTRFSLYVLARDRAEYNAKYEEEVKQWCKDNGFKFFWNRYIRTN